MSPFDPAVLANDPERRAAVLRWLEAGLFATDPETLVADALEPSPGRPTTVIAIGKAAGAMTRGAAKALGPISGLCITTVESPTPPGVEMIIGDHPIPDEASLRAGRRAIEVAAASGDTRCVALISGGGSALCELPRTGLDIEYLRHVGAMLLDGGASIDEINLVRAHLSAVKCGGLARAAPGPIETYVISDVAGAGADVVASGPTIPADHEPHKARQIMERFGVDVDPGVWEAISREPSPVATATVTILADGRTAATAIAGAAGTGDAARVHGPWLDGPVEDCLESFLSQSGPGITVAAGEPVIAVTGDGFGGRNTHAALLAAEALADSNSLFAAFASDGVDGRSGASGAIVDGGTLTRGGDPTTARRGFDSASYLATTGDLLFSGATGTNVADIWLLWRS